MQTRRAAGRRQGMPNLVPFGKSLLESGNGWPLR
jgi:hypothetical protein